jgi:hypothetical protein
MNQPPEHAGWHNDDHTNCGGASFHPDDDAPRCSHHQHYDLAVKHLIGDPHYATAHALLALYRLLQDTRGDYEHR